MQADPAQLRDFAARYTAAWCSQDPTSVAGFYSPGGSLTVNNDVPAVGRSAITEVAQSFMTAFPDMRLVMDEVLVQGDRVEYHWTLIGTNTGPGGAGHRFASVASSFGRLERMDSSPPRRATSIAPNTIVN